MKIVTAAVLLLSTLAIALVTSLWFGQPLSSQSRQALLTVIGIAGSATVACFVVSQWTGNYSQVDKLWSLLPLVYVWTVAGFGGFGLRLTGMAVLVSIWGLRLSWNFWLKGGYRWKFWQGEEDYRWAILRSKPEFQPRWKWILFNFGFISSYQNALILLFTLPAIVALQHHDTPVGWIDAVAASLMLFFVGFETIADWQQWQFQCRKRSLIRSGGAVGKGFIDSGLWSRSRHPNYFAEQGVWYAFYLFSVSASGLWFNWSLLGSCLLTILFMASARFGEEVSSSKYPEYESYQQRVPRFLPNWRRNSG